MKIRYHGMIATLHSWSFVAQSLIRSMQNFGHKIYIKSTNSLEHFPEDLRHMLLPGYHAQTDREFLDFIKENGEQIVVPRNKMIPDIEDKQAPYDIEFAYTVPLQFPRRYFPYSKLRLGIWNYESSIMPPGWQEYIRALDYLLPSSQYSFDIFAANGIPKDKMLVVPHGVDTKIFNPNITPFKFQTQKKVKILHNAIPHFRKLHDRVIKGYLDAFTGDDDVCLILKTKFKTPDMDKPFESNVKEILEKLYNQYDNPAEIEIINDKFVDDIGSLYTGTDIVVSMSSCEGFCLLPGTIIDTLNGSQKIELIENSNEVISHLGNIRKITGKTHRYVENEEIIKIRRLGSSIKFCGTKEHKHLIIKRNKLEYKNIRKKLLNNELSPKWIELQNIEKGDLVAIPKPNFSLLPKTEYILISDYCKNKNNILKNGVIWNNKGYKTNSEVSLNTIAQKVGCSFQQASRVLNNNKFNYVTPLNNQILEQAKILKYKRPEHLEFINKIDLNEEIMELFGLYIAEGYSSKSGNMIGISSHKDEKYAHFIEEKVFLNIFNLIGTILEENNKKEIFFSSSIIAELFKVLFGNCAINKKIHKILWNSPYINSLIKGIFYGDGTATNNKYSFSTSSLNLATNLLQICAYNNILLHIQEDKRKNNINYIVSVAVQHEKRFEKWIKPKKYMTDIILSKTKKGPKNCSIIENEKYFYVPVKMVEKEIYTGYVYNLHIEEDESYTSFGMTTHNCLPLLESLACNSLVIAPRHGGALDFLNDNNSLLVNTKEMIAPLSHQYWTYAKDAVVGDPDTKHFSELLRYAYENLDCEKARIKPAAQETVKRFSWENAAKMMLDLPIPAQSKRIPLKRKTLYIIPYGMIGGAEYWVKDAIRQLDKNVYEAHVAFLNSTPDLINMFKDIAVIEDLTKCGQLEALKAMIEAENYAVINFYNSFSVYWTLKRIWSEGFRCRIVEIVHSELVFNDSMSKVAKREGFVAMIIAVSKTLTQKLTKIGNKNVFYMPQPINWDKFKVEKSKNILKEFNIPDKFVIGFVGRLSAEKNIPIIMQCANKFKDISFVIVGEGPHLSGLKQMAGDNVYFIGKQNNVEKFYSAFDILMLPSLIEGLPLVILEAMISGTPVIASNVGAVSEIVQKEMLCGNPNNIGFYIETIEKLKNIDNWKKISIENIRKSNEVEMESKNITINLLYNKMF